MSSIPAVGPLAPVLGLPDSSAEAATGVLPELPGRHALDLEEPALKLATLLKPTSWQRCLMQRAIASAADCA